MTETDADPAPTLRERQGQRVRDELRDAFVKLVVERGVHAFTLHDVAVEAGVSDRTLYRYFPSREALIDEVRTQTLIDDAQIDRGVRSRSGMIDLTSPESVAGAWEVFDEHADLVRAAALLRHAGMVDEGHRARTVRLRAVIAEEDIASEVLDPLTAIVRTLSGSDGWMRMTSPEFGLDTREAGLAAQWAIEVLIAAARDHDGPLRPRHDDHRSGGTR